MHRGAALLVAALVIRSAAQQPPLATVQLDAVAIDARGRPVADLTVADFDVSEAGGPRSLEAVRFVTDKPRILGVFLDEYHVAAGAAADAVRAALSAFVDREMRAGDRAVIVKPLDSLVDLTLTEDRGRILAAIAAFEGRKGNYTARDAFEQQFMAGDAQRIEATRAQIATSTITALASTRSIPTRYRRRLSMWRLSRP
jgi:hypothetical protein